MRTCGLCGDCVGDVEDRLCRAVVAVQGDDFGRGKEGGEVEDVLGAGGPEAVDRLEVVADDGQPAVLPMEGSDDVHLQPVDVLVLVDEDVVEHRGQLRPGVVVSGERAPVEQEVVEVEQLGRPLALAVGAEDPSELVQVGEAPGELLREHVRKLTLSVHGA